MPAKLPKTSTPPDSASLLKGFEALYPREIDLSLDRVVALLAKLGNPHQSLSPVVHVAGTNGKGSVIAFLHAILEAAGYKVSRYTSPHLVRFHERIVINGAPIEEAFLVRCLEGVRHANGQNPITFFEATTAGALTAFAQSVQDIILLETGLGGRLDATNVIADPVLTVLTPISLDHMEYLGDTVAQIATEKAGIIKPEVACICGPQPPEALAVIEETARRKNAPLIQVDTTGNLPPLALAGPHQMVNAHIALAVARHLAGFKVDEKAMATGLQSADWPARFQRLSHLEKPGHEVYLDGGHNGAGAQAIAAALAGLAPLPTYFITGLRTTKQAGAFFAPFVGKLSHMYTVATPDDAHATPADTLATQAIEAGLPATAMPDWKGALNHIHTSQKKSRSVICGSLYLAGHVLSARKT